MDEEGLCQDHRDYRDHRARISEDRLASSRALEGLADQMINSATAVDLVQEMQPADRRLLHRIPTPRLCQT